MDINKNNYEAWLLDYFEGVLDAHQVGELLLFVEQHPELGIDLEEGFDGLQLEAEDVSFTLKDDLKREAPSGVVNEANYEDFLVAEMEGVISPQHLLALQAFIKANPALEKERAMYAKLKLEASTEIVFANKGSLKKKRALVIPMFVRLAAAAAVALLILFFWPESKVGTEGHLVGTESVEEILKPGEKSIDQETPEVLDAIEGLVDVEQEQDQDPGTQPEPNTHEVIVDQAPIEMAGVNKKEENIYKTPTPILPIGREQKVLQPAQDPVAPDTIALDVAIHQMDSTIDTIGIAAPIEENIASIDHSRVPKDDAMTVWQFVGMKIKTGVLDQEDVADGTLRENDFANAVGKGLDKITNKDLKFKDKSKEKRMSYGFQIGKFGFSRSTSKK